MADHVERFTKHESNPGCLLLCRDEEQPQAFGVAKFDDAGKIVDIVEKPQNPPSNILSEASIYTTSNFGHWSINVKLNIGKFSITDVNRKYVEKEQAELLNIGKETWVDCGTPESLLAASIMAKEGN